MFSVSILQKIAYFLIFILCIAVIQKLIRDNVSQKCGKCLFDYFGLLHKSRQVGFVVGQGNCFSVPVLQQLYEHLFFLGHLRFLDVAFVFF